LEEDVSEPADPRVERGILEPHVIEGERVHRVRVAGGELLRRLLPIGEAVTRELLPRRITKRQRRTIDSRHRLLLAERRKCNTLRPLAAARTIRRGA
jgi:hypothetical protein